MIGESMNRYDHMVEKTYYIHKRYGVPATFALVHHARPLDVDTLGGYMRLSDHVIQVDENHYFIIFAFTEENNAHKAAQNLLRHLDEHFKEPCSCIALDSFDVTKNPYIVLCRLKQILTEIRKHGFKRIDNENILDGFM
jgi:hypothetical protein